MKKMLSMLLVFVVLLSAVSAYASPLSDGKAMEPTNSAGKPTLGGAVNRASYVILDDSVSTYGRYWDQPSGYEWYRMYIVNNTNETLYFTVQHGGSTYISDSVGPNTSYPFVAHPVAAGRHTVSFSSNNGYVSGTVTVRVSDSQL